MGEIPPGSRRIAIVAFPGAEILDITGPLDVFVYANTGLRMQGRDGVPAYRIEILAAAPGPVETACGLRIIADRAYSDVTDGIDTLLISGAPRGASLLADPALRNWVSMMAPRVRRLGSICSGALLLAHCGLLDERRATSHWVFCDQLQADYPSVRVDPDRIYVRDGNVWTSGGVTSGIDMALAMVEEDHGPRLALLIARYLVVFLKRPGGQSQFSAFLASQGATHSGVRDLQCWIVEHLHEDLRIESLAERLAMSPRNFSRIFHAETGMTAAKYVERARTDAARQLLESTDLRVEHVAKKAGFGDAERMRRAFMRQLGASPADYRARFGGLA
ncbi:MAG: GlxA family transcriptional regulator [Methylotetracoccus sp.]